MARGHHNVRHSTLNSPRESVSHCVIQLKGGRLVRRNIYPRRALNLPTSDLEQSALRSIAHVVTCSLSARLSLINSRHRASSIMSDLTPLTPSVALSLSNAEAAQWNKKLMEEFQAELERNPEADLLSMFPHLYRHEHRNSQYLQLSHAAKINLRTLHDLRETLRDDPEINLSLIHI